MDPVSEFQQLFQRQQNALQYFASGWAQDAKQIQAETLEEYRRIVLRLDILLPLLPEALLQKYTQELSEAVSTYRV